MALYFQERIKDPRTGVNRLVSPREFAAFNQQQAQTGTPYERALERNFAVNDDILAFRKQLEEEELRKQEMELRLREERERQRQFNLVHDLNFREAAARDQLGQRSQKLGERRQRSSEIVDKEKLRLDRDMFGQNKYQFNEKLKLDARQQAMAERAGLLDMELDKARFGMDQEKWQSEQERQAFIDTMSKDRWGIQKQQLEAELRSLEEIGLSPYQQGEYLNSGAKTADQEVTDLLKFLSENEFVDNTGRNQILGEIRALQQKRAEMGPAAYQKGIAQILQHADETGVRDLVKPPPSVDDMMGARVKQYDDDNFFIFDEKGNPKMVGRQDNTDVSKGKAEGASIAINDPSQPQIRSASDYYRQNDETKKQFQEEMNAMREQHRKNWEREHDLEKNKPAYKPPSSQDIAKMVLAKTQMEMDDLRLLDDDTDALLRDDSGSGQGNRNPYENPYDPTLDRSVPSRELLMQPRQPGPVPVDAKRSPGTRDTPQNPTPEEIQQEVTVRYQQAIQNKPLMEKILSEPSVKILAEALGEDKAIAAVSDPDALAEMARSGSKDPVGDLARLYVQKFVPERVQKPGEADKYGARGVVNAMTGSELSSQMEPARTHQGQVPNIGRRPGQQELSRVDELLTRNGWPMEDPRATMARSQDGIPKIKTEQEFNGMIEKGLLRSGDWYVAPDGKVYQVP